ncbi:MULTISPECIES: HEXXH motif domain-containing protein [Streptacidiphilus]|uniref:HEXXH motif domain-containing protein n=1 Tax=Streptacidiphilus cavernicola TaxID=3342716 RepID=A0ABV6UFM1_9ACTN|nr:HEXXH motif domain-containing protein [Streptacidiphilus jeojiense]
MLRTLLFRAPQGRLSEAWNLLVLAEKCNPDLVRRLLLDPQTGLWLTQLLRRLGSTDAEDGPYRFPLAVDLGYLSQLAAGAAIASCLDATIDVPLRDGSVMLPGLGRATFDHPGEGGFAEVRVVSGAATVSAYGQTMELPADPENDAPGWEGLRRLRAAAGEHLLVVAVDDLGPYGLTETAAPAARIDAASHRRWQELTEAAWSLLSREHPTSARALSAGLLSVIPLPRGEILRPYSASTSDAPGCVLLSEPEGSDEHQAAVQLAVTLIHEFRHSLLNGLLYQVPLFRECSDLFHAPWRDDPRPLGGLLHGAYSFSGVTAFWRDRLHRDSGPEAELAAFEFSLWRRQTWSVLSSLDSHTALTGTGADLVRSLQAQVAPWLREPVAEGPRQSAAVAAWHHHLGWRAHHLTPANATVRRAVAAWKAGQAAPAAWSRGDGESEDPFLHIDPLACRLDVLAVLHRMRIVRPEEFERLRHHPTLLPAEVPGATRADLALVAGETGDAVKLYEEELLCPEPRPNAWAGLVLAMSSCASGSADDVERSANEPYDPPFTRTELIRAVHRTLSSSLSASSTQPTELVRWFLSAGSR